MAFTGAQGGTGIPMVQGPQSSTGSFGKFVSYHELNELRSTVDRLGQENTDLKLKIKMLEESKFSNKEIYGNSSENVTSYTNDSLGHGTGNTTVIETSSEFLNPELYLPNTLPKTGEIVNATESPLLPSALYSSGISEAKMDSSSKEYNAGNKYHEDAVEGLNSVVDDTEQQKSKKKKRKKGKKNKKKDSVIEKKEGESTEDKTESCVSTKVENLETKREDIIENTDNYEGQRECKLDENQYGKEQYQHQRRDEGYSNRDHYHPRREVEYDDSRRYQRYGNRYHSRYREGEYDDSRRDRRYGNQGHEQNLGNGYHSSYSMDGRGYQTDQRPRSNRGGNSRFWGNNEPRIYSTDSLVIEESNLDLFTVGEEYSLAHCVGSDFIMGAGIAVMFRKMFNGVGDLLNQQKGVGDVAVLHKGSRFIFYLVTKKSSYGKPTLSTLKSSVKKLRELCVQNDVHKLAIPRIGCGLDGLFWEDVRKILIQEFQNTEIKILVCFHKPSKHGSGMKHKHSNEKTIDDTTYMTNQTSNQIGHERMEPQVLESQKNEHNGHNERNGKWVSSSTAGVKRRQNGKNIKSTE